MKCGREISQISGTVCNAIFNSYNILRALEERKVDAMKPPAYPPAEIPAESPAWQKG